VVAVLALVDHRVAALGRHLDHAVDDDLLLSVREVRKQLVLGNPVVDALLRILRLGHHRRHVARVMHVIDSLHDGPTLGRGDPTFVAHRDDS